MQEKAEAAMSTQPLLPQELQQDLPEMYLRVEGHARGLNRRCHWPEALRNKLMQPQISGQVLQQGG
jgi:hypothetical protein